MEAKIVSKYSENENNICYMCKIKYKEKFSDNFLVYIKDKNLLLNKGDIISFNSKFSKYKFYNNYNEFNYGVYLNTKNIVGTLFANDVKVIYNPEKLSDYKTDYSNFIDSNFSSQVSGVIKAIMYGDKDSLDENTKEKFKLSGIVHILTISGTAIYMLKTMLFKIFNKCRYKEIIGLIFVSFYVFFCVSNLSLFRAYLMYLLNVINKKLKLNLSTYNIILITALLILIYNPYSILSFSFWYSFMATLGIIIIYPRISSFITVKLKRYFKFKKFIFKKLLSYILRIFSITVSVQISILPINLFSCNKIYILSVLSNIFSSIILMFIYFLGFFIIIFFKFTFISNILVYLINLFTKILIDIANIFSKFEFLNISINKISIISVILIYILMFLRLYGYIIIFNLKYKFKKKINFNVIEKIIKVIMIIVILIDIYLSNFACFVYYFNVGQGNMAITKYKDKVIVSDIGSSSTNCGYILKNFIDAYNLNKIDYIILTHMHKDHINGIYDLEKYLYDKKIIINNICASNFNDELIEFCKKYGINMVTLSKDDNVYFDKININVLSPDVNNFEISKEKENENSLVYILKIKDTNFLYMGDATCISEKNILENNNFKENNIFVYQVGHHGSNSSTSEEFISAFDIKNAVISSEKRMYGHPTDEVLKRLNLNYINTIILEKTGGKRFYIF